MPDMISVPDGTPASAVSTGTATDQTEKVVAEDPGKVWKARADRCKKVKRQIVPDWNRNIDFRRGKCFDTDSDEDRIAVNIDWPQTKAKQAALFSQVPTITATPKNKKFRPAAGLYARALNEEIKRARVGVAMDEVLPDAINAAGVGAVLVGYEARTVSKRIPVMPPMGPIDPAVLEAGMQDGSIPSQEVPDVIDRRFYVRRISPADLLWDVDFVGSDWDDAPWVGYSGRLPWAEAQNLFKLKDEDKKKICSADTRSTLETLKSDSTKEADKEADTVSFDEIFFWDFKYNPQQQYYKAISRIVLVKGLDEPIGPEPWNGQKFDEANRRYLGACKFPVRVLTLTYLSDEIIPPSDSAIARPQVLELIDGRTHQKKQRDGSQPMRWHDVNRIDQSIQEQIMRGKWLGSIPVNGDGTRAIGEVARANYPSDNWEFDRVAKLDIQETWQIGSNQLANFASTGRSATESKIVESNFQTRIGYERARCGAHFVGIAEVLAGLMALFGTFDTLTEEEKVTIDQAWPRETINQELAFTIRPDSTVLLDSEQRVERLLKTLNMLGKSGFINPQPIIEEIIELTGLDPAEIMTEPQQPEHEQANISLRISGLQDLLNPLMLAMLVKTGQAPTPEELETAKKMLASANGITPGLQPTAGQLPPDPNAPPATPPLEGAHPEWTAGERVTKRVDELGG